MKKKTIIHFILSLGRGGAETMLVRAIRELPEYYNIVVTLFDDDRFGEELQCDEYICMRMPSVKALPLAIPKFRKLIRKYQPDIVHSHLVWPTVVARFATPGSIPLITTIHTSIATAPDYRKWLIRAIDRYSYLFRESTIIAVAEGVKKDYFSVLNLPEKRSYVLYTFVDIDKFKNTAKRNNFRGQLKVISTGSFRVAKNFPYLVRAFSKLKKDNVELHIYGGGPLKDEVQRQIDESGAPVILKGEVQNIEHVLPDYHLFIMASLYEGFSLAVLEAMAVKLPIMLSDIQSFREQGADTVIFFDLKDENDLAEKVRAFKNNYLETSKIAERSYERVLSGFTLEHHVKILQQIYRDALTR